MLFNRKKSNKKSKFLEERSKEKLNKEKTSKKTYSQNKKKIIFSELSIEELHKSKKDIKKELQDLRFQLITSTVPNVKKIRSLKRNYARIMTILTQKEYKDV